jgi:hypothetical protein
MTLHIDPVVNWVCGHCDTVAVTRKGETNRLHNCPGLHWITAPLTPEGVRCEVRVHEREDYVRGAMVTTNSEGRPIMAVETIRDDGNDIRVFAECATTRAEARM